MTSPQSDDFARALLSWFDQYGRKDLPWQQAISPYRVWVSEIMLQQTQVKTVIPYYERFMNELPTVEALAEAEQDQVLHLWSGLGYYARARNLQKAAQIVCRDFGGNFPDDLDKLCALPGIGRSTAGAILAIAFKQHATILDGNVKRVLARYYAVDGWPGTTSVSKQLWQYAEALTPKQRTADYTQAIMDLGATLCTRTKPQCQACPVSKQCTGHQNDNATNYPGKKPKKALPEKHTIMLLVQNQRDEILLQKRPPTGIWGGLWSFPELSNEKEIADYFSKVLPTTINSKTKLEPLQHTFSHYRLNIQPYHVKITPRQNHIQEAGQQWHAIKENPNLGLAAPVSKLLLSLRKRQPL